MAELHDPGFDRGHFAHALLAVDRWPDREYEIYGPGTEQIKAMRERIRAWAAELPAEHASD